MEHKDSLGLYLHIPFCRQKCLYCDFYSLAGNESRMDAYTDALCAHLKTFAPGAASYTVDTVYFGGGTPSYLGETRLCAILDTVNRLYKVADGAEITLEANPDSARDVASLKRLRQAGFNRISLGMQSADDQELKTIGRIHTAKETEQAVSAIREAGFDNLSLDLIYGLPDQTGDRWMNNLAAAVALHPDHLSCYGLKVEPGTPLHAMQSQLTLPGDEEQADFYLAAVDFLAKNGYEQYEISNFAKPGFASRHNLKYWMLEPYAGFGPGAHSDFGSVRYAWTRDLSQYIAHAASGHPPVSERNLIGTRERAAEYLMLGLRTVYGLDPQVFETRYGFKFSLFLPFLEQCAAVGYAVQEQGRWHLTPLGFLVSNPIIGGMIEILDNRAPAI